MNSYTAIKVLLRGTHLDSHAKPLQHFAYAETQNVQSNNFLFHTSADNLHLRGVLLFLVVGEEVVEHVCKAGFVYFDFVVAESLASLWFREPDCANFRMREDDSRDVLVRQLGRFEFRRSE